jgi:hypothetical protein
VDDLRQLADLIKVRNTLDGLMARIVGRPAHMSHVGEYVASRIFNIKLHESASHKGSDGSFRGGPLDGQTVNVKWSGKRQGLVDFNQDAQPDYYLVLTGPKVAAVSSRGTTSPWVITSVYLFDAHETLAALRARGTKNIGIATSVPKALWEAAEIYPTQRNPLLPLSQEQREMLALFAGSPTEP